MARKGSPPWPLPLLAALAYLAASLPTALPTDADALLNFKTTLSGGGGGALTSWTPGSSPCNGNHAAWAGVICVNGTVYGLRLENMSLSGALSVVALEALPGLRTVSFMNNSLDGPMPEVGKLPALKSVYLSRNRLSGPIPDGTFDGMRKLKKVYLSENGLSGPIPTSLARLPNLLDLRLDGNAFDGGIPELRQPRLRLVNVSYNNLEGPIPEAFSKMNADLFAGNKNLCGAPLAIECEPLTNLPAQKPLKKFSTPLLITIIVIAIGALLAILGVITALLHRRSKKERLVRPPSRNSRTPESSEADQMERGLSKHNVGSRRVAKEADHGRLVFVKEGRERFELQDLLKASAEVLGSGNFGSSYKAILPEGPSVVVKRFKEMNGVGREDFQEHMRRLGRLSHRNLLPLVAYYYRKEEKLLVTDYIVFGSLAHMLHGNRGSSLPPLDWPTRLKIVKGVARGLAYLYDELPMLILPHGHLKSSNVLLDESFEPLLTDYALIPVMNQPRASQVMVAYKSPEVTQYDRTSKKSDVWTFGILILEILTGKFPATYLPQGTGGADLAGWVNSVVREEWRGEVFDSEMKRAANGEGEMLKLLQIGLGCCEEDVEKRLEMGEVLEKIEGLKEEEGDEGSSSFVSEGSKDGLFFSTSK